VGAIAGYFYYFYIGCSFGTCTISYKPWNSTLQGGLMGRLVFNLFLKELKTTETK